MTLLVLFLISVALLVVGYLLVMLLMDVGGWVSTLGGIMLGLGAVGTVVTVLWGFAIGVTQ